jgi:3-(3-hydroxy-phenyl)propionate hydroxylase
LHIVAAADARLVAATRNRAASSTALRHLQAATPREKLTRRVAAQLAPMVPALGQWLDQAPFGPTLGAPDRFGMYY